MVRYIKYSVFILFLIFSSCSRSTCYSFKSDTKIKKGYVQSKNTSGNEYKKWKKRQRKIKISKDNCYDF